ncbi:MAG: AAA family ATPase [Chloroflexi bacterium]|nr:AAA family ATPase [Chloroflexota bacterium]
MNQEKLRFPRICSLNIQGYRPFRDLTTRLSELEVIVGANGAGKSSLFEFLRFLRDAVREEIPPEIVAGSAGRQIFHRPGPEKFQWNIEIELLQPKYDTSHEQSPDLFLHTVEYQGAIRGPVGHTHVSYEQVRPPLAKRNSFFMDVRDGEGHVQDPDGGQLARQQLYLKSKRLALGVITNPSLATLYYLREFIAHWRFYSAFDVNNARIRGPVPVEQEPLLREDAANLSAVLFYLMTEHPLVFDELKTHLRSLVPGFRNLTVKARGGPGEVIAFWQEQGVDDELSLADLSDGILRLLCWMVLCLTPNPPTLICIDEPDQGVHPRTLPVLAGLFEKASTRTQLLLATHASYFLTRFDISRVAVMKKVDGESKYLKPGDSETLQANLTDFGIDELEAMHRNDELEVLA